LDALSPTSKSRQPFASLIPNVQHVDPLFALVADEVQVTLRFFQHHALELRAPVRWTGRAGIADCLEVLDHFQPLLEENLGVIGMFSPACVDSRDSPLGALR
jgi:hypothetical protein